MWEFPWWKSRLFVHALSRWDACFSTSKVKKGWFSPPKTILVWKVQASFFFLMKSPQILMNFPLQGCFLLCTLAQMYFCVLWSWRRGGHVCIIHHLSNHTLILYRRRTKGRHFTSAESVNLCCLRKTPQKGLWNKKKKTLLVASEIHSFFEKTFLR